MKYFLLFDDKICFFLKNSSLQTELSDVSSDTDSDGAKRVKTKAEPKPYTERS